MLSYELFKHVNLKMIERPVWNLCTIYCRNRNLEFLLWWDYRNSADKTLISHSLTYHSRWTDTCVCQSPIPFPWYTIISAHSISISQKSFELSTCREVTFKRSIWLCSVQFPQRPIQHTLLHKSCPPQRRHILVSRISIPLGLVFCNTPQGHSQSPHQPS